MNRKNTTSYGRYGGGSGICESNFGPVTFEFGTNASQKHMRGVQNHPKARPGTTQKAPKVNLGVPRSKEAPQKWAQYGSAAFRGTPIHIKSFKATCPPIKSSLLELIAHSAQRHISDARSAAQSPPSTRAGGKDDGS